MSCCNSILHLRVHLLNRFAQVEEQRRYLGGDSEHTVLVKGLDFALLEQNKARAAAATEDDDTLEEAFLETVNPKKRTREEIVAELKIKRAKNNGPGDDVAAEGTETEKNVDRGLEEAKQAGKFKPIGFKPIGGDSKESTKKKKAKKVKKSAKADKGADADKPATETAAAITSQPLASTSKTMPPPQPEPGPIDDDFDIFADAGEYTGVDLGDDDEDEDSDMAVDKPSRPPRSPQRERSPLHEPDDEPRTKWFDLDDEPKPIPQPPSHPADSSDSNPPQKSHPGDEHGSDKEDETKDRQDEDMDSQEPIRLVPLTSSAMPSIKDILAMDDQVKKEDKRKARKEKKKGGGGGGGGSGLTTERKVERDYQRYAILPKFLLFIKSQ